MTVETPIKDRVAQMHAAAQQQPPVEAMSAFAREQAELAAMGLPAGIAALGTVVADAELLDAYGAPTTLDAELRGRLNAVVFYRGAWCPYCNLTLKTYQELLLPRLDERGVGLIAVSPQKPDGSLTMKDKHELAYAVVSDPGNTLARQLGVVTTPGADARAAQLSLGLDLTAVNADGTIEIPMPTVALVDSARVLRWIDVHPDYSTRTEPAEILEAIDNLRHSRGPDPAVVLR